ncbi:MULTISPECIES: rod-binding protein [Vibrio]|jgi:flagellar protein FlgJ|uniref:Flagellar protein n=1 Tax=Vibrio diazotrophicus TaxID=685 RepID=A0A2J8FYM2_VIBDI|nr:MULTISPECIES: rod-binding protein [Vibrio]MCF7364140.1 rod-binding protein [Vibrio sp. A1-b2]PNH78865.1 flagellar protein [Vibrio diazotrophicus]PNH95425.1 flagellar protein [Vibrio diazotrophicus]PNI02559.1 flagellar protein [Vibrio diazotrophicus]
MKIDLSNDRTQMGSVLYHDNTTLTNIKHASDEKGALETVAKQFEAMFLQLVLRQMRSSSDVMADEDSPFSSKQQGVFRDMYDGQMAIEMAKKQSSGIADMLVEQLGSNESSASNIVNFSLASQRVGHDEPKLAKNVVTPVNHSSQTVASNFQERNELTATNAFSQSLIRKLER